MIQAGERAPLDARAGADCAGADSRAGRPGLPGRSLWRHWSLRAVDSIADVWDRFGRTGRVRGNVAAPIHEGYHLSPRPARLTADKTQRQTDLLKLVYRLLTHVRLMRGADTLYHRYDYGRGGYEEYKRIQILFNKRKLNRIFADEQTLEAIARHIEATPQAERRGLCHGARSGWEVQFLRKRLACEVIGTDISDTACQLENMVHHDFHDVREDWRGKFSFIYSNSLDQAFDPKRALDVWADQLTDDGRIYIEHTIFHSAPSVSRSDPFGAHPMIMPYLFFEWGRGKYELVDILRLHDVKAGPSGPKSGRKGDVWVFVLAKARAANRDGR